ncbi:MAG: PQQ-like beta-propeller repeat protein [Phycisphaerae bacterium]|jgi:outer membrane protein assembly factor BamB|nr:PQQ-like beta-propeller repeat protein [Phycisphaerae bacterium]
MKSLRWRISWVFACLFVVVLAGVVAGATGDWPQWRGARRDGTAPAAGLAVDWKKQPPRVLWKTKVGTGFSSIAVSGGTALTMGNQKGKDSIYAFDAKSGMLKWKHSYPCDLAPLRHEGGPFATPTVVDGRVYTLSKLGQMFCLELKTGKVVWQVDLVKATGSQRETYGFAGSPLVAGGVVIVSAGSAGAGFDAVTGKLIWKSKPHVKPGHASPVPIELGKGDKKKQGVLVMGKTLMSIVDPATGRPIAQRELIGQGRRIYKIADPLVIGDSIFVTSTYGYVCTQIKVAGRKLSEVWKNKNLTSKFLSPVLVDGHIVGGHLERWFRCIDPATGELKWEEKGFSGNLIRAGGVCLVLTTEGDLILADVSAKGFKELGRAKVLKGKCWTMPALAGGKVYCRNVDGDLVCVDVGGK